MKKNILFLTALLLWGMGIYAQDLSLYTIEQAGSVTFQYPCGTLNQILNHCQDNETHTQCEVPPWIIGGSNNYRSYFLTDGTGAYVASSQLDMIHNNAIDIEDNGNGPFQVSSPEGCPSQETAPWRRTYYSMYTAQYLPTSSQGPVSIGFLQGENKTKCGSCPTTIIPNYPTGLTSASCDPSGGDYYPNYTNFVCGAWLPNTLATNWGQQYFNDMGPITWPSSGYQLSTDGQKAALGTGGPSSIQSNGYLYVYYKDISNYQIQAGPSNLADPPLPPAPPGRSSGIKVVRAPLTDALNPLAYQAYYWDGSNAQWNQALPTGFTKENLMNFLQTPGPLATTIIEPGTKHDYNRWSVAQAQGTNYWLGVGSYSDNDDNTFKVVIMYSTDLVTWQGARVIYTASQWYQTLLGYPIFLSNDGWSNTSVDPNDFYIVGTMPNQDGNHTINNNVYRMHFYIPGSPPPPPPPPCYDDQGNQIICPMSQNRQALNGAAAVLDESNGNAAYVYPNPGHGLFQLTYALNDHAITQLNVLDMTGRKLQTGSTSMRAAGRYAETVNISGQAKGMYLLELLVNGGKKTFKIIYQ